MRLLFLNHNVVRRGGTYHRAYAVARYLVRRGHAVTLLTISPTRRWRFDSEVSDGVEVIHTPDLFWGMGRSGWDPWDTLNRLAFVHGGGWDIVHAWDCRPAVILPALYARRPSRGVQPRLITDWCDWSGRGGTQTERPGRFRALYGPVETYFEESFRLRAEGTTVISRLLYARARDLGVPADTLCLLPQGCDDDAAPLPDRAAARRRLSIAAGQPVVLSVGTLLQADAEMLFDSCRAILARRPECRLFLVGKEGVPLPPDLRRASQVRVTGFVDDGVLRDYMAACNCLIVPMADNVASRARWPSRVNPFLAAGRAVVMPRVGDLAELLARREAGVVTGTSAADLAAGVLDVLDSPARQAACESRAEALAHDELSWPRLIDRVEDLYQRAERR